MILPFRWNFCHSGDTVDLAQRNTRDIIVWLRSAWSIPIACPRCPILKCAITTTWKTTFFALSYPAIVEVYNSTCGFVNYSQCCTCNTKIKYWSMEPVFGELQPTLKFVYTDFKITVYDAKIRSFMYLSCHIKKLQHKTLLRWQLGLVYIMIVATLCASFLYPGHKRVQTQNRKPWQNLIDVAELETKQNVRGPNRTRQAGM